MRTMSRYRIRSRSTLSTRMAVDAGIYNPERQAEYASPAENNWNASLIRMPGTRNVGRLFSGRDVARTINRYAILLVLLFNTTSFLTLCGSFYTLRSRSVQVLGGSAPRSSPGDGGSAGTFGTCEDQPKRADG